MSKWADGRYKALPLKTVILRSIEDRSLSGVPSYKEACIFDAIYLGLQTVSWCSKYFRGNPTSQCKKFCKVLISAYTGTFVGCPIAFINDEFSFLS